MQVERLRLAGFKSFVEPAELSIQPGLTGIVGPNGCGKSNLLEALRWVMGEASARRLRGGEMDDVIFAGSASRPARNLAEVVLTIDNSTRDSPVAYGDSGTIEVARRIVRGGGSVYRINGGEARAHDVQLLFADAATGAHSGALVGQNRIGALIAAKPAERRALLDEAAGTAGLHARRHEAELKLQGAEDNLLRLDDVVVTLAAQLEGLKKQSRQAQRYRRLGDEIRRTEARLLAARWAAASGEAETLAAAMRAGERDLAAVAEAALAQERARAEAEAGLPPLRQAQATAAARVQRLDHAREALEAELRRVVTARAECEQRLGQLEGDVEREAAHLADAEAARRRLGAEHEALMAEDAAATAARREAEQQAGAAAAELAAAETGLQQMTEACAAGEARRAALERRRRELAEREGRLCARLAEGAQQREALQCTLAPPPALAEAAAAVAEAAAAVDRGREAATEAAEALAAQQQAEAAAGAVARAADIALARLQAEAEALGRVAAPVAQAAADASSILALLEVPRGFEAAIAAVFASELAAPPLAAGGMPADGQIAGWRALPPLVAAALPEGARPLAATVMAPAALGRSLAHTGWVDHPDDGWRLQPQLGPGQNLVDRDGRLWRWDGYVRLAPAAGETAERLRQRNRLKELAATIKTATLEAARTGDAAARARTAREAAAAAAHDAVGQLRTAEVRLARARDAEVELTRRTAAAEARLAALSEAAEKLEVEFAELAEEADEIGRSLALLPDPGLARSGLEAARAQALGARRRESEARSALDRLAAAGDVRRRRLAAVLAETASWDQRHADATAQRATLIERRRSLAAECAALAARPAAIATESAALAASLHAAAGERAAADEALATGEMRLRQAAEVARQAAAAVTEARERRAGLQARDQAAADCLARLRGEIDERLALTPEALTAELITEGETAPADAGALAGRLERLLRERDAMGPVNLLAEREAGEVEARLDGLGRERADLTAAIARLRRGIATLDEEGRKRIAAAFEQLNAHFGELFARLFGGGRAELAWTDGEDPLSAGLDILVRPPGKHLSNLSLLSGGEQALTAIALIFAVFLTRPAPLCVLDEVDAPLDDANVDAFCRLVADIADTAGTRFLVITHHRVTMARMDRLYGVTMAERGVSQLVSVDLARAAELRQSA